MPNLNVVAVNRRKSKSRVTGTTRLQKTVKAVVKNEIKKDLETKIYSSGSAVSTALAKQTVYSMSPVQSIAQGTNNNQRIGNEILLKTLTIRALFQNTNLQDITYRILVLWHDTNYSLGWGFSGVSIGSTDLFFNGSNLMNTPVNLKLGLKLLYDKNFKVNAQVGNGATPYRRQTTATITVPLKQKGVYLPSSNLFKNRQLYVVIIPDSCDSGTISGVTSIGAVDLMALVSFTDA